MRCHTKTNRSYIKFILLNFITFGIYSIFFLSDVNKDLNKACYDEEELNYQDSALKAYLLGLITFGIYYLVWQIKLMVRVYDKAEKENLSPKGSIVFFILSYTILAWTIICPLLSSIFFVDAVNRIGIWFNTVKNSVEK